MERHKVGVGHKTIVLRVALPTPLELIWAPALDWGAKVLLGRDGQCEEGKQKGSAIVVEPVNRISHSLHLHNALDVGAEQRDAQHFADDG